MPAARAKLNIDRDDSFDHGRTVHRSLIPGKQRHRIDESLRRALHASTSKDLIQALDQILELRQTLPGTALTRPSAPPPSVPLIIKVPNSTVTLPLPAPPFPFKDREKRYGLSTDDLREIIGINFKEWREAKALFLEEIYRVDVNLYNAIRYHARTQGICPYEFSYKELSILSSKIVDAAPQQFAKQALLLKALGHYHSGMTRLESARTVLAELDAGKA